VVAFVRTGTSRTVVYVPRQSLDRDRSITLDARKGRRVSITTDRPDAVPVDLGVTILPLNTFEGVDQTFFAPGRTQVYAVPVTGGPDEFDFFLRAEFQSPAKAAQPYAYHFAYGFADKIPGTLAFAPHDNQLGQARSTYFAQGRRALGQRLLAGIPPVISAGGFGIFHDLPLPAHVTDLYSPTPTLWQEYLVQRATGQPTQVPFEGSVIGEVTGYPAGRTGSEDWNRAVVGPELQTHDTVGNTVNRFEDALTVVVWPWAPSEPGHSTTPFDQTDFVTGRTVLSVDGSVLATNDQVGILDVFGMPADQHTYVLSVTGTRAPRWSPLAKQVDLAWTFRSAATPPNTTVQLPLLTVRASGAFDDLDRAPAGTAFPLTLRVETQKGAAASAVRTVTVRFSTDDGRTWCTAPVTGRGATRTATIPNPMSGFVSLRLSATDAAGDRVDQTVIRAYQVR